MGTTLGEHLLKILYLDNKTVTWVIVEMTSLEQSKFVMQQ